MSQLGFEADGFDNSEINYRDWVSKSLSRSSSLRETLALLTNANESSFWPTTCSNDSKSHGSADYSTDSGRHAGTTLTDAIQKWPSPRAEDLESAGNHPEAIDSLTGATRHWQTPAVDSFRCRSGDRKAEKGLDQQARKWRTPDAPSGGGVRTHTTSQEGGHQVCLAEQAEKFSLRDQAQANGQESSPNSRTSRQRLNPAFACWLMGWPTWWTHPAPISSAASEMESWRSKLRSRLQSFLAAVLRKNLARFLPESVKQRLDSDTLFSSNSF
jgi:hypothetical protein